MLDQEIMPGQAEIPAFHHNVTRAPGRDLSYCHRRRGMPSLPLSRTNSGAPQKNLPEN